eukprot:scaffold485363_cov59-Attheya_sp.AAC.1
MPARINGRCNIGGGDDRSTLAKMVHTETRLSTNSVNTFIVCSNPSSPTTSSGCVGCGYDDDDDRVLSVSITRSPSNTSPDFVDAPTKKPSSAPISSSSGWLV